MIFLVPEYDFRGNMNPDCWVKSCNFLSQITFCMKIGLLKFFLMHLLFTITGINVGNGK